MNSTTTNESTQGKPARWTAAGPIYALMPNPDRGDVVDHLNAKLGQLAAMLANVVANPDAINDLNREMRSDYYWCMEMAACECQQLVGLLAHEPDGIDSAAPAADRSPHDAGRG